MFASVVLACAAPSARAQDIEPRSYSNAPIGVNFLVAGYAYSRGGVSFDPSLPVTDTRLRTDSLAVGYARVFDAFGQSGKFDVIVPASALSGSATYAGEPVQRDIEGLHDPRFRVSINLLGAPSLDAKAFRNFEQDLIVGASFQVAAPLGQYDDERLINLGTNRWSFKPEVGMSKAWGPWTVEVAAAVTFYTDNRDFYGGKVREQDPLGSVQVHGIYSFPGGIWASADATYFAGGRTAVDGKRDNNLQQNWRAGATLAIPLDLRNSIKLYASSGVSARTGNDFDLVGIAWQVRWGVGL